jgi:outer membrane protein TolC
MESKKATHLQFTKCIKYAFLIVSLFFNKSVHSQQLLTLNQAITLAQQNSINAQLNKNDYGITNQTFRQQQALLFPQVNLNANLPGYNSSITSVTQPDGTIKFTTVEQAYSTMGVSLSQKIAATGGTFTASSNINRFDRLSGARTTNYNTQPFVLGLNQPLFRFNETAYNLKISKISKLIGSKVFVKQQEQLAADVSSLFHTVLQAQTNIVLLTATSNTTDTLLKTAKLKLALGKIGEEEYLQIQLEQLNTTAQLQQAQNDFELTKNKLCNMLNIPTTTEIVLEATKPTAIQQQQLEQTSSTILFTQYKQNNPEYEQQRLAQMQNYAALQRAKYTRLPSFNIIAGYGSNQSAPVLSDAYQNLLTQQNATIGIAVPLFTSGANTASFKIADYQLKNFQLQLQQLEQHITNDIMSQILSYNLAIQQINNAQFADSIAQRRYEISYNKYQAGKITYTDLLLAQNQQLQAKQGYLNAVSTYWQAYYQLRVTTLYDIEKQETLYKKQ